MQTSNSTANPISGLVSLFRNTFSFPSNDPQKGAPKRAESAALLDTLRKNNVPIDESRLFTIPGFVPPETNGQKPTEISTDAARTVMRMAVSYFWEGGSFPLDRNYKKCINISATLGLPPFEVDAAVRALYKEKRR